MPVCSFFLSPTLKQPTYRRARSHRRAELDRSLRADPADVRTVLSLLLLTRCVYNQALCLFHIYIRTLILLLWYEIKQKGYCIYPTHSIVTWKKKNHMDWGRFLFYIRCNSPSKSATLLLCLQPLYDFCNEISVFSGPVGAFNSAGHLFPFSNSRCPLYSTMCISRAAALTRASTCEAKMLISQTVPIGIMPRSASGEG